MQTIKLHKLLLSNFRFLNKGYRICSPYFFVLAVVLCFSIKSFANPGDWTYGFSVGLGGTGLRTYVDVDGENKRVERAEGPGAISIYGDRIFNNSWTITVEHIRGYRLSPFSSGVSFTGGGVKYYFWNPVPTFMDVGPDANHVFTQQFTPFIGATTGLATGSIYREPDKIKSVEGSGLYVGLRSGMDILIQPGLGLRGESSLSATLTYPEKPHTTLAEFSMRLGLFFFY